MTTADELLTLTTGTAGGVAFVPQPAALSRLNYFDGKLLRAADLAGEQAYLRFLAHLVAGSSGDGIVHGYDVEHDASVLRVGPGLAYDAAGRPLLLPGRIEVDIDALLADAGEPAAAGPRGAGEEFGVCAPGTVGGDVAVPVPSADWWVVTISHAEALCGQEDVYGRLCEDACATATDRPYRVEGIVVRAEPLRLGVALRTSAAVALTDLHLRSRLASAIFADEARRAGSLVSGAGLRAAAWCAGARPAALTGVPVALLVRAGETTAWIDMWAVRRERIDVPPDRYWHGRLRLRPWRTFLAQVLQFQCQLRGLRPAAGTAPPEDDPCRDAHTAVGEADTLLTELDTILGGEAFELPGNALQRYQRVRVLLRKAVEHAAAAGTGRVLIDHGIVELPPAGFLPVDPSSSVPLDAQVRRLVGEGVDLRFCTARPDVIARAFASAQHLDRIPLTTGLDDPARRPPVDVLVPDGVVEATTAPPPVRAFAATVRLLPQDEGELERLGERRLGMVRNPLSSVALRGVATVGGTPSGGATLRCSVGGQLKAGTFDSLERYLRRREEGEVTVERVPDEEQPDATSGDVLRRVSRLAAEAARHETALRAGEGAAVFRPSLEAGEPRTVAGWLDITVDGPLQRVQPGDRVPVTGLGALVFPARALAADDLTITGALAVDRATDAGPDRIVEGTVAQALVAHRSIRNGQVQLDETLPVRLDVKLRLRVTGGTFVGAEGEITVGVRGTSVRFFGGAGAGDAAGSFRADLAMTTEVPGIAGPVSERRRLGRAELVDDPATLQPSNAQHQLAVSSVRIVAATLARPDLGAEAMLRLLFPPPATGGGPGTIRSQADWVLFSHRADVFCTDARPAPPVAPRRFDLFVAPLDDADQVPLLRQALTDGDGAVLARLGVRRIDEVAFVAESDALVTSATEVADTWVANHGGSVVLYGAVAAHTGIDSSAVNRSRAVRLAEVVGQRGSVAPTASFDVLPGVPPTLERQGSDGIVVLGATDVATTCIEVRAVEPDNLDRLVEMMRAGDLAGAVAGQVPMEVLGQVELTGTAPTAGLDAVRDAWGSFSSGLALVGSLKSAVLVSRGDEVAGSSTERTQRAMAIIGGIGEGVAVNDAVDDDAPVDPCPATLVLVMAPDRPPEVTRVPGHLVYVAKAMSSVWTNDIEPGLEHGVLDDERLRELEDNGLVRSMGFVVFERGTTNVGGPFTVRRFGDEPDLQGVAVRGAITVYSDGAFTDDAGALADQAAAVARHLEAPAVAPADVRVVRAERPPSVRREVVTFLLLAID